MIEYSSEVVVGPVVVEGFGFQRPVDSRFSSLHRQSVQLHSRGDAAWRTHTGVNDETMMMKPTRRIDVADASLASWLTVLSFLLSASHPDC